MNRAPVGLTDQEIAERLERYVGRAPAGWLYFKSAPSVEVVAAAAAALRARASQEHQQ
jgi:plasmid maintenance system antidote protein VapI